MSREQITESHLSGVLAEVGVEVRSACQQHPSYNSAHEAYAVILEELDEFKAEVWKKREQRSDAAMRKELLQTACTCVRAIIDLGL